MTDREAYQIPPVLADKSAAVVARLAGEPGLIVALSGGVDSAVLLALAVRALGPAAVLAVTGASAAVPKEELEDARAVAAAVGARWEQLETHELARPGYRANDGQRCFHCRTELFEALGELAKRSGSVRVAYGAILDDLGDDRPGMLAAERLGVLAPLLEAGLTKRDVRILANAFALPVRDKPAAACLASRIPVGTEVTSERLGQVERAERALRSLGFRQIRVRHHGEVARLELEADGRERLGDPELVTRVVAAVRGAGFRFVTLDLEGYRPASSGSDSLYSIEPSRPSGQ